MLTRRFDYIVLPGDTLFGIALKFNVPLQTLLQLNNLEDANKIFPGQTVVIPVSEEFYQIARLVESQCGKKNEEVLQTSSEAVPTVAETSLAEKEVPTVAETEPQGELGEEISGGENLIYRRYRVRRGDTVYLLAKSFNTTTGNILALNPQITDVRNIPIGSMITIPVPPESAFVYVVRPGDTLYKIAQANGITVEKIMKYNYIENDHVIYPGQQLVIVR